MNYRYSSLMDYVKPSPVAEMLHFSADPTLISFAGGMPDATIFPVEELRAAFDRALAEKGAQALQYSTPEGLPSLREKVCERMARAGVKFDFVGFDACLMATYEMAAHMASYADYMVASEELEPGIGWNYQGWSSTGVTPSCVKIPPIWAPWVPLTCATSTM